MDSGCKLLRLQAAVVDGGTATRAWKFVVLLLLLAWANQAARANCTSPENKIVAENCLAGNPASEWDIAGAGDPSIQGFATDISVNAGQTVAFKIKTNASQYQIDIYRMGYYGGLGARRIATISPSAKLPQTQPACLTDSATKLLDCGNWATSATWPAPAGAVSGIYFARLTRTDTGGASHIVFIVRNDAGHSDVLFQTADETWQAYNDYGGNSLYGGVGVFDIANRAFKVSYNRPFNTRSFENASWVFYAEYPMVRWLEANGYDVSYFTSVDVARAGSLIQNHKLFLSAGHDEYWSGQKRASIEAARSAGVNLAFFSGNEAFWKTRWENAIDGTGAPYRTLVCYKETLAGAKIDPASSWTGTWRDPRFSPPSDGGRPENAITGTLFKANGPGADNTNLSIQVPAADGKMRFWRNTSIASLAAGQTAILPAGTLGYEWDADVDNGSRPAGAFGVSTTTHTFTQNYLLDNGATYGAGTATHRLILYRASSGALVFGAGTVQWTWGLDSVHDENGSAPDIRMQQATLNLFADMGVQPATLQAGLVGATKSTDTTPPTSTITSPASGATVTAGVPVTIAGTAADYGVGMVGGVEVSVDGGNTWHPATGRANWTYTWTPGNVGTPAILSRAVDDSGNLETPSTGSVITVAAQGCPCSVWPSSAAPAQADSGDAASVEVGMTFKADYNGYITGIRFYKSAANTGTHTGHLWTSTGTLLAQATFTNESASGWQQVNLSAPVAVTANTTYVVSYLAPAGHYSADRSYFAISGVDNPPLHVAGGTNGLYSYTSSGAFPVSTFSSTNYWVDAVYIPAGPMPGVSPGLLALPAQLSFSAYRGQSNPPLQTVNAYNQGSGSLTWTATASASWIVLPAASGAAPASVSIGVNTAGLAAGSYTGTVTITGSQGPPQTVSVALTVWNVLLSSTFASGAAEGWAVSPSGLGSNWTVVNQSLQYNGGGASQLYSGNSAWSDYSVQASIKLSSMSNYPGGIRGRVNPQTGAGYAVWLYPAEGLIRLLRHSAWNIDAGYVILGQAAVTFDTTNFHPVALGFQGNQIRVSFDNATVLNVTDSTYTAGLIALDVSNRIVTFDDIAVTGLGAASPSSLGVSSATLNFSTVYQGSNPASQTLNVTSSGTGSLAWTAAGAVPWITLGTAGGLTPGGTAVAVSAAGLTPGTYTGNVQVTSLAAGNSPQTVAVNLTVNPPPPVLSVAPLSMSVVAFVGAPPPAPKTLVIENGGYGPLSWTGSTSAAWLSLSATSGTTPSAPAVNIDAAGLAPGTYTANVTIASSGVSNSPVTVPVTLTVLNQNMNEMFASQAAGWIISPMGLASGWSVAGDTYTYNGSGLSQSCAGNSGWSDYTFATKIQLSTLSNWPGGVRARVNPATGAGYAVWLYPGTNQMILYRVSQWDINGPGLVALAQANLSYDTTSFHDLQIVFQGSAISVYWDASLLMTASDPTYSTGYVCMDAASQRISYQNVRVSALQPAVTLSAAPAALTFASNAGTVPPAQTVSVAAAGASTTWAAQASAAWLNVSASSSLTPGTATVTVNPNGLSEGVYTGSVTIFAPGATNAPIVIPVTLAVKTAVLSAGPASLAFFGSTTVNPPVQNISVQNAGTGTLAWNAAADAPWIGLTPSSGTAPGSVAVSVNAASLPAGQYSGNIQIASASAANSPATIPVSLQVGSSLFFDNFSSGSGNWTASPLGNAAGWSVGGGVYSYNGQGATQSWAGSSAWTDYTVAMDVKLASLNNYPGGIRGRVDTTTGASYGAWIYPSQGIIKLYRIDQWDIDAGYTLLAQSTQLPMDAARFHNLRLRFQGAQIQVYYDNALVTQATDSTYTKGAIAIDVSNQPVAYTNVAVIGF